MNNEHSHFSFFVSAWVQTSVLNRTNVCKFGSDQAKNLPYLSCSFDFDSQ